MRGARPGDTSGGDGQESGPKALSSSALPRPRETPAMPWSRFYRECRAEMEFRYGRKGFPEDAYKVEWALGSTVQEACKRIADGSGGR